MAYEKPTSIIGMSGKTNCLCDSKVVYGFTDDGLDKCLRNTGIDIIGDVAWGTHFCQFYQTKDELIETLVPYFKAGLELNEFCLWITSPPLAVEEAKQALRASMPDFDVRLAESQIEIIPRDEWYSSTGKFDQSRVLDNLIRKMYVSLANGYAGIRLSDNTLWLDDAEWKDFADFECALNSTIQNHRILALCAYSTDKCGVNEIADVVVNHEFAMIKRGTSWILIESSAVNKARQTLQTTLDELDSRTEKLEDINNELTASTDELAASNEELRTTEEELRREIIDRTQAEATLQQLNRTLKAHSDSDKAMMRTTDEMEYLQEVCRIIVEDCGHSLVWIGYAENDEAKTVRPVAYSGFEEGYLETLNITWADTERGQGPTGTAIRTSKPSCCQNMLTDPRFKPWRAQALKRGYASSIVLPLMSDGKAFGAISIYSKESDPFTTEQVELLRSLTDDLAYGITAIRLRIAHAKTEQALRESEQQVRLKLDSILSPEGDIGDLELGDILDSPSVQSLMNSFYELVNIPMAIVDLNGKILVGAGWQDICTKFHRVHSETHKHCIESDTQLSVGISAGEYKLYKCKNNMWDIATPIMIGGEHVGNLFAGQFFFDDEPVDHESFLLQAREFGFNENEYIAALDRVPRLSRKSLD